ncbi:MAG: hypothetical protein EPN91_12810 [Salinibacterium sp.]|nr:MAG: hypothetical protein EPN91_12810 [Salinibacterium sp.]
MTYVRTWQGFAYVASVTDVFSRCIVGWNVASTLKADILPLQALDVAVFAAGGDLTGLTHHSDHGSQVELATLEWVVVEQPAPALRTQLPHTRRSRGQPLRGPRKNLGTEPRANQSGL